MSGVLIAIARYRPLFLLGLWGITVLVISFLTPYFLQANTVPFLLEFLPVIGLLGLAQTLIMLSGGPGIDISIGANLSLSAVFMGWIVSLGMNTWLAIPITIAFAAALGAVNAVLITQIGIPSLMATLATFFTFEGLALATTGGSPLSGFASSFGQIALGRVWLFPYAFLFIFVPIAIALHVMLRNTKVGNHIYAAGNDENAAYLYGVEVKRLRASLYVLGGALAGMAAVIMNSWFLTARPDAGQGFELLSVTIAVLGGTHIFGGEGSIPGTLMAILIVVTLQIGLQLANISQAWQLGVIGVLLIGSIILNNYVMKQELEA